MLAWHPVYVSNIQKNYQFFSFENCHLSISCIVFIYDCVVYDGNY